MGFQFCEPHVRFFQERTIAVNGDFRSLVMGSYGFVRFSRCRYPIQQIDCRCGRVGFDIALLSKQPCFF